jgi:dTDP-4-dehydrorhamnose reductase
MKVNKKILITGAEGMLGRAFQSEIKKLATTYDVLALSKDDWDVRDKSRVDEIAKWLSEGESFIIHCAALVSVEACNENLSLGREIIVSGTEVVVELAEISNSKIIYPQSFLIYDGVVCPIDETTLPNPQTYYATLKLEAENLIAKLPQSLIIRMAGFFGGEEKDKNFVGVIIPKIHKAIKEGEPSFDVGDRVWQPTYTKDLASNTLVLCEADKSGVYVMACEGHASFHELASEIADSLGFNKVIKIKKVSSHVFSANEPGRRPTKAIMNNKRLKLEGLNFQRPWKESLREYLSNEYFDQYRE